MFNRLADVLNEEHALVSRLGEVANKKSDALIKEDINMLNVLIETEQGLKTELQALELERGEIEKEITEHFGAVNNMNINAIVDISKEPVKARLLDLKEKLNESCKNLKEVNDINLDLTRRNLSCIDYMVRSIFSISQSVTYCKMGSANKEVSKSLFDNKA